jgi:hypothetical protein
VPANRIGSYEFTTAQLKTIQEVTTLTVFAIFSMTYLGESSAGIMPPDLPASVSLSFLSFTSGSLVVYRSR